MLLSSINNVIFASTVERSRFLEQRGKEKEKEKKNERGRELIPSRVAQWKKNQRKQKSLPYH